MSVRATGRLIGDLVKVAALSDSPKMVVKAVDEETKIINTVWFSDCKASQEGFFPASALDRVEEKASPKAAKPTTAKSAKGRKSASKR